MRITKKERRLYALLEKMSSLLSNPETYGMRAYYAMPGTPVRDQLIKQLEAELEPYREVINAEREWESLHSEE